MTALEKSEVESVEMASKLLGSRVAFLHGRLGAECALVSSDPTMRAMLRDQGVDRQTVLDYVGGIKTRLGIDLLAAFTPRGRATAVIGDDALADNEFGESKLFKSALRTKGAVTGLWGSNKRLLAMSACAVRFGDDPPDAVIALGLAVDESHLLVIRDLTATRGTITVADAVVATAAGDLAPALGQLRAMPTGIDLTIAHAGAPILARAEGLGDAVLPVRILWMHPIEGKQSLGVIGLMLWIPALAAAAVGILRAARGARA